MYLPSRRVATRPSSRKIPSCWDSVGWRTPVMVSSSPTLRSPWVNWQRISKRSSLAKALSNAQALEADARNWATSHSVRLDCICRMPSRSLKLQTLCVNIKCCNRLLSSRPFHRSDSMSAQIEAFLDPASSTYSYVVYEQAGGYCAIVDTVLDYDPAAGRTATVQADRIIAFVREQQLQVQWLLETHAHADHLSAAPYLRRELGGKIAIGQSISKVQGVFKTLFNLEPEFCVDGSQFDHLFAPNESFMIGNLKATALHVPGHRSEERRV